MNQLETKIKSRSLLAVSFTYQVFSLANAHSLAVFHLVHTSSLNSDEICTN